ncbi:hypothetical protein EI427_08560 [Flammeovirga pectinis]|uniref:DUF2939 domain-containing protein n=1 Tax=Flammeovirga pectinis TaxID=2494373 RepID=A0A3S9P273_9BACT|nr:hypothetical protein [Flammeovirga pectinis]AZQ62287.1 hypothetical protein EI427_08560 [Flammeovirga pectinis]
MNKGLIIISSILITIAAIGGFFYLSKKNDPEMTFIKIKSSIDNKDLAAFNQLVDVDQVLNSVIDQYIDYSTKANNGELDISTGLIAFMRPSIISIIKEQIETSISQGQINIPKTVDGLSTEVLGLLTLAHGDGANFKGIKDQKIEGTQAELTLQVQLDGSDRVDDLIVKFRQKGDIWQIYDVKNLAALVDSYVAVNGQ